MEPFKVARKSQALPFPHKEAKMEIRMMPPLPEQKIPAMTAILDLQKGPRARGVLLNMMHRRFPALHPLSRLLQVSRNPAYYDTLSRKCLPGAVEYMLKCIPGLAEFPNIQDPTHQENIMAAAVILRQSEEMEEETGEGRGRMEAEYDDDERVNFLAVTQRIIDSVIASPLDHSLATAAYWIVIRQEIYYALTRETVPHLRFDSDRWPNASIANNMIMFVGKVAQWRWGQKSLDEWTRLKLDEQKLIRESLGKMEPILELKADRAKGQIFPTVWYSFDVHATAAQHFQLAQMILTAENPQLEEANRAAHRKAEAQVRSIVLNLCGIALNHPRVQPCLVNAVIAITLYGDYFTDHEEREALVGIINRTRDLHVWQMKKPYQTLLRRWEAADSAEI
ncbi:hypothetical protein V6Z94_004457 [Aspergillus fumigatus]